MLIKDKAIVLRKFPYKNGFILEVFTREQGKLSFIVHQRKNKKIPIQQVFPLDVLEIEYQEKSKGDLFTFSSFEIKKDDFELDVLKNCIATFLAEFIKNMTYPKNPESEYFDFLEKTIDLIDSTEEDILLSHISVFVVFKTGDFFGFPLNITDNERFIFIDSFSESGRPTKLEIPPKLVGYLLKVEEYILGAQKTLSINRKDRALTLKLLIAYYRSNVEYFKEIKSLDILREVLN